MCLSEQSQWNRLALLNQVAGNILKSGKNTAVKFVAEGLQVSQFSSSLAIGANKKAIIFNRLWPLLFLKPELCLDFGLDLLKTYSTDQLFAI